MDFAALGNVFATRATVELIVVCVYVHTTAMVMPEPVTMESAFVTKGGVAHTAPPENVSADA